MLSSIPIDISMSNAPLATDEPESGAFETALEEALEQDLEFLTGEEVTIDQIQRLSST